MNFSKIYFSKMCLIFIAGNPQHYLFNKIQSLLRRLYDLVCAETHGILCACSAPQCSQGAFAMPFGNNHNQLKMKYSTEAKYPDLTKHKNRMSKVLTPAMYECLHSKQTPSGFTLDDVIQTGVVDNPGKAA